MPLQKQCFENIWECNMVLTGTLHEMEVVNIYSTLDTV